jgi:hypothetical protein
LSIKFILFNHLQATEEQIKLLNLHIKLQQEAGQSFSNLSVAETIEKCLSIGLRNHALKVKNDFAISELRFAHVDLACIIKGQKWNELEVFLKIYPKFPYKPVIDGLMKNGPGMVTNYLIRLILLFLISNL